MTVKLIMNCSSRRVAYVDRGRGGVVHRNEVEVIERHTDMYSSTRCRHTLFHLVFFRLLVRSELRLERKLVA